MGELFAICGRIVPYTRMTQRSKWRNAQAKRYLDWKERARMQLKPQMYTRRILPKHAPLSVTIRISQAHNLRTSDLDNNVKAILDAAQGIVFADDRDINELHAFRELGSGWYAELEIERMEG